MSASDKWVPPPGWEGLTNEQALSIYEAFVKKWVSFLIKEVEDDHAKINSLPIWDQLVLRAKWEKKVELELTAFDAFRRYKTPAGEVELIAGQFGDQLGLPAQSFPADVSDRLEWCKRRIAADYERSLKSEVNKHGVKSPIEQIFLMEWRFLRVDERHGVKIRPQDELKLGDHTFTIDFMVEVPGGKIKLAIELDGHEFHE
jgi:hypothetical protein